VATTREGTEISFPNGMLVQSSIENLSRRSKFLIFTTLSLSSQCSLGQLQCLIARVREMLYAHARVEQETARFRLAELRGSAYHVELFAYIRSRTAAEFAAIQEDILFRIGKMVEAAGVAWAVPSQLSYRSTKPLVNSERAAEAERTVQRWQDNNENPFPDFPADRIAELRGSLPYPGEANTSQPERTQENKQIIEAV
jgi:MscS family membrane protein